MKHEKEHQNELVPKEKTRLVGKKRIKISLESNFLTQLETRKMMGMSGKEKSLFLAEKMKSQDLPPLKIQHVIFKKLKCTEKIDDSQKLTKRKKLKTDIFTKFYRN